MKTEKNISTIRAILIAKKKMARSIELKDWTWVEIERAWIKTLKERIGSDGRSDLICQIPTAEYDN